MEKSVLRPASREPRSKVLKPRRTAAAAHQNWTQDLTVCSLPAPLPPLKIIPAGGSDLRGGEAGPRWGASALRRLALQQLRSPAGQSIAGPTLPLSWARLAEAATPDPTRGALHQPGCVPPPPRAAFLFSRGLIILSRL